jgi:hypothetical protein
MIVYDGNNRSGSLVILVIEEIEDGPTGEQSEEGGARGRRVEEDFATRETDFEQQKGLIPRQDFKREWIGLGAEFADANRLLIRSYRRTDEKKEFDTAVVYDFRSKAFSVPSCQENERIKQANFGEVGLERPVASPTPDSPVASAGDSRSFLQHQSWGIRSPFDIDLFLSARNDQAAIDKMSKADRIKILRLASEVTIVGEDSGHGMYQVRPVGKLETFYVSADFVGPTRPPGRESEIAQKHQIADDCSTRIAEFIEDLDKAIGLATLANSQDIAIALNNLKGVGIDFNDDLTKIEAAYKVLKNALLTVK